MVNELKHVIGNAKELPLPYIFEMKELKPTWSCSLHWSKFVVYVYPVYNQFEVKRDLGTLKNQWLFRVEFSSWFIIDNLRKWINYVSSFYYHFSNQSPCFRQLIVLILYSNHLPFPCKNWIGESWKNWNVVMFLRWHVLTE